MRITPDHPRLRIIAVAAWLCGTWAIAQLPQLAAQAGPSLVVPVSLLAVFAISLGVAFWLLGTDRRAGVVFDAKGLMLNLGSSASFVAWENIADVGISQHRRSLLALGSQAQLGIRLRDPQRYLQSYEERLPASRGPLGLTIRLLERALRPLRRAYPLPTIAELEQNRARTGFHILIPEAQLGGRARGFLELIDSYRLDPALRESLRLAIPG